MFIPPFQTSRHLFCPFMGPPKWTPSLLVSFSFLEEDTPPKDMAPHPLAPPVPFASGYCYPPRSCFFTWPRVLFLPASPFWPFFFLQFFFDEVSLGAQFRGGLLLWMFLPSSTQGGPQFVHFFVPVNEFGQFFKASDPLYLVVITFRGPVAPTPNLMAPPHFPFL